MSRFLDIKVVQLKFRVRFKHLTNEFDSTFDTLDSSLRYRNQIYTSIEWPKNVMIKLLPRTRNFIINNRLDRNGKLIHNIQINTIDLKTHVASPTIINVNSHLGDSARIKARIKYEEYADDYNKIAKLYNRGRLKQFNELITKERWNLKPLIPKRIEFNLSLWASCYESLIKRGEIK